MKCKSCGTELAADAKFCTNCGAPVGAEKAAPAKEPEKTEEPKLERVEAEVVGNANASDQAAAGGQSQTDTASNPTPPPAFNNAAPAPEKEQMVLSIVSLVCGILSLICCCCCGGWSCIIGIAGVVTGIISLVKKQGGKGMAIAGIVCGGIGVLIGIPVAIIFAAGNKSFSIGDVFRGDFDGLEDFIESFDSFY